MDHVILLICSCYYYGDLQVHMTMIHWSLAHASIIVTFS